MTTPSAARTAEITGSAERAALVRPAARVLEDSQEELAGFPETTRSAGGRPPLSPQFLWASVANLFRYRELIKNLVLRDVRARYKQATLGVAWAVVNPFLFSLITTFVMIVVLKKEDPGGLPVPVFTYFGVLVWGLFSSALSGAAESLVAHMNLITKVYFPREVFPLAAVAGKVVDFAFGLLGLVPLLVIYHAKLAFSPMAVLAIPVLFVLLVFTTGLGLLFACANLFYRDVRYLIQLAITLWYYLIPVLYPLDTVPSHLQKWYLLNPVAVLLEASRRLAFSGGAGVPWRHVAIATVMSFTLYIIGYIVFKRREPRFAEVV